MKKTITILLAFCLCVGLCACGKADPAQTGYPEGWDRIAEATATLNAYYACETEDDFRAVCHSSYSGNDVKMMAEGWRGFRETWSMDTVGISKMYVRKIQYIETYNGCDIFLVSEGYETTDGGRTPDDPLPLPKANSGMFVVQRQQGSLTALAIENGRYVLANIPNFQSYTETIAICSCDLGTVVIPGDACKGCNGTGVAPVSEENSLTATSDCLTCDGTGMIHNADDAEDTPCPDCSEQYIFHIAPGETQQEETVTVLRPGFQLQTPCSDCDGTGLENYTLGDCPDCGGKGYHKIG